MQLNKEIRNLSIAALALLVLFLTIRFKLVGLRVGLGFIILYLIPVYYIMKNSGLDNEEKIFFTIFLAVGIVPSITYTVGFISLKLGLLVSFILLLVTGWFLGKNKTKLPEQHSS